MNKLGLVDKLLLFWCLLFNLQTLITSNTSLLTTRPLKILVTWTEVRILQFLFPFVKDTPCVTRVVRHSLNGRHFVWLLWLSNWVCNDFLFARLVYMFYFHLLLFFFQVPLLLNCIDKLTQLWLVLKRFVLLLWL